MRVLRALTLEHDKRRAPAARFSRRFLERCNGRVLLQQRGNDIFLDALAPAVNDAHFSNSRFDTLLQVLFHHARDVLGLEGVKINNVFERKNHWIAERRIKILGFIVGQREFPPLP